MVIEPFTYEHTFAISLAVVFSDTICKYMVDGNTNAIRVPIVAPVNASTNSTTITQKSFSLLHVPDGKPLQMRKGFLQRKYPEGCNNHKTC